MTPLARTLIDDARRTLLVLRALVASPDRPALAVVPRTKEVS